MSDVRGATVEMRKALDFGMQSNVRAWVELAVRRADSGESFRFELGQALIYCDGAVASEHLRRARDLLGAE